MIKLSLEEKGSEMVFHMMEVETIDSEMLVRLKTFSESRGGFFRADLKLFSVRKRWTQKTARQVFELLNIPVKFIDISDNEELYEPLHKQRIYFGKEHYGKRWEELPKSYLSWIISKMNEERIYALAYAEIKRRDENDWHIAYNDKNTSENNNISKSNIPKKKVNTYKRQSVEVIGFGKHKGTAWTELPLNYLLWLAGNLPKNHHDMTKIKESINQLK
ncbi:hypothetical protein KKC13_00320 [bacterium]|nr:hypothetical protein [bacterium]MBU1957201.1 hypothetical protein [bacterium]